jgi:hypothetical protein
MYKFRKYLSLIFAATCLISLQLDFRRIFRTVHRYNEYFSIRGLSITALYTFLAIIYGMAWWTVWNGKPSGRGLGIAASVIYIPVSLWGIIFFAQPIWGFEGVVLAVGIAGLVAFLWSGGRVAQIPMAAGADPRDEK